MLIIVVLGVVVAVFVDVVGDIDLAILVVVVAVFGGRFPLFCRKWPLPKQSKSSWPLLQQQQLLFDCLNSCKK